ncbi:arginine repressor [Alloscardovia theropitheci]|uniref:Arginine repressor n=1 Tax=Alloscardovia theropitheci TaxID=2496842 RepID=A0A4R0QUD1_9BIFI|nr:arginine repressor [Alloscardovia theropitheci]TCD53577.1 arginine repressor [Alloscardovia theropitheci]
MNAGIPSTRAARLSIVERIIAENIIESQQQLIEKLAEEGIKVTQATLSRDLDDLRASKVRTAAGTFAYAVAEDSEFTRVNAQKFNEIQQSRLNQKIEQQLGKVISGLVTRVVCAQNLVVIHTPAGAAQYVASAIDKQPIDSVAGTIAGDDTVLMITTDNESAQEKLHWLLSITSNKRS